MKRELSELFACIRINNVTDAYILLLLILGFRLLEFQELLGADLIDLEKLRKLTFRGGRIC